MDDMSVIAYLNRGFPTTKKPLDVQIEEMKEYLSAYVISASDTVYLETNNAYTSVSTNSNIDVPLAMEPNLSGSIRLYFTIANAEFYIYKNGVQIAVIYNSSTSNVVKFTNIDILEGDLITFKLGRYGTSGTGSIQANSINVCGDITPLMQTNLIELI